MPIMPELKCDWATHEAAKYACEHWHYSKCIPKSKLFKIGVWEDGVFIGVVIFGVGATADLVKQYGLKPTEGCELVRIALREHKHFVSEIMMTAVKKLHEYNSGLRLIVSFADPEQGHVGAIYQATNWIFTGITAPCDYFRINGEIIHPRTISHLPIGKRHEIRSKAERVKMQGKYRYLMPLDKKMRKLILPLSKPYPKKDDFTGQSAALEGDGRTFAEIAQERG